MAGLTAITPGNRVQALRVDPGVMRLYGRADIATRGLVSGWAVPEEGHTWNDGLDAIQWVEAVQQPAGPVTLTVEGVPYVFGEAKRQDITLYANGYRVGFWRMPERRLSTMTTRIEPEQWVVRRGLAYLNLTWHLPGSMRPNDIGDGADGRLIGFAFRTLLIADARDD